MSTEDHLGEVGGRLVLAEHEYTRPANATAYTALDAVADGTPNYMTFVNAARKPNQTGYVVKARLTTDQKTNTARFRLHLFHTAPTAIADNAPLTLLYANKSLRVGYIDFPACTTEDPTNSTAAHAMNADVRLAFTTDPVVGSTSGDPNLYGLLETLDAFTPASGQKITVELAFDQN